MTENKKENSLNLGLLIFLLTLILIIIASLVFGFYDVLTVLSFNASFFATAVLAILDIAWYLGYILLTAYTAYSIYKFKPNAIPLARVFLLVLLAQGLVLLAIGLMYGELVNIPAILPITYSAIWLAYLAKSGTVKMKFPREKRESHNRDKLFALALIAIYVSMTYLLFFFASEEQAYVAPTYANCIQYYGAEECNQQIYNWCMEDFNDNGFCTEYKSCLDTYKDDNYCTTEYFGISE
jgi:hypothetical protein